MTPVLKSRPSSLAPADASTHKSVDFDNDIYISYANIDNQPLSEGQSGWISDFHRVLEIRLAQLRGEKARICRSLKLQENDYFDDKIVVQFPKVALLVSVLSPRYLKSQWCIKELREFCKSAEETGGIRVAGNKSRIFKVIKTPVPLEQQPQELLNDLLAQGCDWVRDYLKYNASLSEEDRHLCDGVSIGKRI